MKIAMIAPLVERVPPKKYGGTERLIHSLTEELIRRGHKVTLFASGDSLTSATLNSVAPKGLRELRIKPLYDVNPPLLQSLGRAFADMKGEFDVIHDSSGYSTLPFAEMSETPVVMTIHGPILPAYMPLYREFRKANLVSISRDIGSDFGDLNHIGTVYNGLNMEYYPFSNEHDGYLLYVGRICHDKGTHNAILAAKRLNLPLIIAAKIEETEAGHRYFRKYVKPHLNSQIQWVGEVDEEERNKLMTRAMAFLHPAPWREPFGLTLIEAMACGAPVIAFNRGSIPEIIQDGKTGFVVNNVDELCDAIRKIDTIDRAYTRKYSLENFNEKRMTTGYEEAYKKVIAKQHGAIVSLIDPKTTASA
ncbi:glycosyltransferase family 4 protein [Acetobacteraceae bacterium]|nr:glycosyltransferase family 4 protein [Candidatus Parcubacteria bacterium]